MSATTTIQINGSIQFSFEVVDFELAKKIDLLLKQNPQGIVQPTAKKIQDGNGRATLKPSRKVIRNPDTKEHVLQLLKERCSSKPFTTSEANELIKTAIGVSSNTVRRSLKMGIEKGNLQADSKGVWHFLELASIPA